MPRLAQNPYNVSKISVSEAIRELYEAYPYPSRIPGGSADPFLEYIWSFGEQAAKKTKSFLDAGCGTGLNVMGGAAIYPHFQVYGCDLNRVGLEKLHNEAAALGLTNLHLKEMDLLNLDPQFGPEEGFDIIYSTGVIHHTRDPVGILKSLARRLAPNGVLRLMVYGELGRYDLYRFAGVARKLYGNDSLKWTEKVAKARALMAELKKAGETFGVCPPPVFRGPWEDAERVDDVEFADRYLNPHDQPFSVKSLQKACEEAGLQFLDWFEPRDWDLELLLPEFAASGLAPEDSWERFALIEELFDRPKLDLYLVGPDYVKRRPVKVGPDTYIGLNPQLFLNCIKARGMSFHRAAQLRLNGEEILDRDEGQLLEGIGRRFLPLKDLLHEMPNPTSPHWLEVAQNLVDKTFLFSPHPPA